MSNFTEWEQAFTRQIQLVTAANEKIFNEATQEFYNRVVDRTPVGDPSLWKWPAHKDYHAGTLKEAWTYETTGSYAKIENTTPYAYRVEATGWSTQAPNGMMRITALEWNAIVDKVSKRYKI